MCQSKADGGKRCQNALRRQRDKSARETALNHAEKSGFASVNLVASPRTFEEHLRDKWIVKQTHPNFPELTIYSYSKQAQTENKWDDLTTEARGLIVNSQTGEIVARPFSKFFNYGQDVKGITDFPRNGKLEVMEKADGSLGVMYQQPDGKTAIATKASMDSPQARKATELYNKNYDGKWNPDPDYTYCFEVIYPDNRVVVDYGETEDLMLLGARHKITGRTMTQEELDKSNWPGLRPILYEYNSLGEVLDAQEVGIQGQEGFVVNFVDHDKKLKFKFQEYLELHRKVSNLNVNRVYDAYKDGIDLRGDIPDEFYSEVEKVNKIYDETISRQQKALDKQYETIMSHLPKDYSQKEFAKVVFQKAEPVENLKAKRVASYIFNKQKGNENSNRKILIEALKPVGKVSFSSFFKAMDKDKDDE